MEEVVKKLLLGCSAHEVEIEARIRKQIVTPYSARLLINSIDSWDIQTYSEKKKISKHNRKCTYRQRDNALICKSSIAKEDVNDMWCAVHVSIETSVPAMSHILDATPSIEVTRYRYIDKTADGFVHYIDVVVGDDPRVEVETADSANFDLGAMMRVVMRTCTTLQGNKVFIGYYDWKTVMHVANTAFGPFCIEKKQYQKPRTMTADVLFRIADKVHNWSVTPKVDGIRKFLVTANNRVFSLGVAKDAEYVGECETDGVTVLDCEYYKDTYYIFDVPVHEGEYCGNLSMDERTLLIETAQQTIHGPVIHIKPYEKFSSFEKLEKLYEQFSNKYDIDGLIFVDSSSGYMQNVPKWKVNSTVDLEVGKNLELSTCDGWKFTMECANTDVLETGIWEFSCSSDNVLTAMRPRPDKLQANSMHIVQKNIFNTVPGTLFTGKGFYLMRKYHNMVKKQVIIDAKDFNATIMDIGTGQGGDVGKWKRASFVFCIEPSVESTDELRERYEDDNVLEKLTIINSYLLSVHEDDIGKKIDIFTAFFCMNQWKDDDWKVLQKIVKTKGTKKCRLLAIAMTDPREHKSSHLEIVMRSNTCYNIKIHDTRIMDIDEHTVLPAVLTRRMSECGLKLVKQERLNDNDFMTREERRLSAMYTLFVYHKF